MSAPAVTIAPPAVASPASVRIRQARELLADLVLEDEFDAENGLLLSAAASELSRILVELDQIAGLQRLFELWVLDAP